MWYVETVLLDLFVVFQVAVPIPQPKANLDIKDTYKISFAFDGAYSSVPLNSFAAFTTYSPLSSQIPFCKTVCGSHIELLIVCHELVWECTTFRGLSKRKRTVCLLKQLRQHWLIVGNVTFESWLCGAGGRVMTHWVTIISKRAPRAPLLDIELTRMDDHIVRAKAQVLI